MTGMEDVETPVVPYKPDEVVNDHYGWKWSESTNKNLYRAFGSVSALSFAMALIAF